MVSGLGVAVAQEQSLLRVVVRPSKTDVRVNAPFKVSLGVENTTASNQTVRVMNCSWYDEWQTSNTNVIPMGWACTKNFAVDVTILPGDAYTNQLEMMIEPSCSSQTLKFHMGFTPIGCPKTYWSDDVALTVLPPDTWRRGTAIYRDRNHDGKIDWEVSGENWRFDGADTYKADTNFDGFYDIEYRAGGFTGRSVGGEKNIHEKVPAIRKDFVSAEKPAWME